jgi:hypothetical protein
MYYALDVRRVIPRRITKVWSQTAWKAFIAQSRREQIITKPSMRDQQEPGPAE